MASKVPNISLFKKGQKILIGSPQSFGIYGVIVDIVSKDSLPVKVDANLGSVFELDLVDYGITWFIDNEDN